MSTETVPGWVGNSDSEEWSSYEPPKDNSQPPEPKEYTFVRVTDENTSKAGVSVNGEGVENVWFMFRGQIQGGPSDGRIAFGSVNTFASQYRKGTTVQDFILASKSALRPTTAQLVAEIKANKPSTLERIVGPFNARTSWKWYCKSCDDTFLSGYAKAKSPKKYEGNAVTVKKVDGKTHHTQQCPNCKTDITATLVITTFIVPGANPAINGNGTRQAPAGLPPSAA